MEPVPDRDLSEDLDRGKYTYVFAVLWMAEWADRRTMAEVLFRAVSE